MDWTAEQSADFIAELGLLQYADVFVGRFLALSRRLELMEQMNVSLEMPWLCFYIRISRTWASTTWDTVSLFSRGFTT
jgi:hypothetical protein